jgi:hypothetical protein
VLLLRLPMMMRNILRKYVHRTLCLHSKLFGLILNPRFCNIMCFVIFSNINFISHNAMK